VASWPTHDEVLSVLRMPEGTADDDFVESCRLAAIDYCAARVDPAYIGPDPGDGSGNVVGEGIHMGALLLSARLYRRRDSLDGTIGWGEMGVVRVGLSDPDVVANLAPYLAMVIG
jgi:hypothetical protein